MNTFSLFKAETVTAMDDAPMENAQSAVTAAATDVDVPSNGKFFTISFIILIFF